MSDCKITWFDRKYFEWFQTHQVDPLSLPCSPLSECEFWSSILCETWQTKDRFVKENYISKLFYLVRKEYKYAIDEDQTVVKRIGQDLMLANWYDIHRRIHKKKIKVKLFDNIGIALLGITTCKNDVSFGPVAIK